MRKADPAQPLETHTPSQRPRQSGFQRFMRQIDLQSMVIPGIILVFVFSYIPMYGVVMAFQHYDIFAGFWHSRWVGWDNLDRKSVV